MSVVKRDKWNKRNYFENRFMHVSGTFNRMGQYKTDGNRAFIEGEKFEFGRSNGKWP